MKFSYLDSEATARVQEIDPALRVVFDGKREKLVVLDTEAPGGTDHQIVMLIQETNGAFRPFDGRTMESLRKMRPERRDTVYAELDAAEDKRRASWEKGNEALADGLAEDLKWLGKQHTPSVAWRERSAAREAIRAEARG